MKLFIVFSLLVGMTSSESGCVASYYTCHCSGIELKTDEPLHINTTSPTLIISNATGSISAKTFAQLTHVNDLRILFSKINSIEEGALCASPDLKELTLLLNEEFPALTSSLFANCGKLKYVALANVLLEKSTFDNLPNLEILYLTSLDFPHFTREYLQPLNHLKTLVAFDCKFEQIDAGAICISPELKTLSLSPADFSPTLSESHFENCNGVEEFVLYPVGYSKLQEGVFSSFVNLKSAVIHRVDIGNLSNGHLRGLNSIENLVLEDSVIETIDKYAFEGLTKLTRLTLQNDHIRQIDSELFTPLTSLTTLILSHNQITSIDNITHPTLKKLEVFSNLISSVDPEAVRINLPSLESLNLGGNNFTREYAADLGAKLGGIELEWIEFNKVIYERV